MNFYLGKVKEKKKVKMRYSSLSKISSNALYKKWAAYRNLKVCEKKVFYFQGTLLKTQIKEKVLNDILDSVLNW